MMDKYINNHFDEDNLYFLMVMLWDNSFVVDGIPSFLLNYTSMERFFSALSMGIMATPVVNGESFISLVNGMLFTYLGDASPFPQWCTHLWDQRISCVFGECG